MLAAFASNPDMARQGDATSLDAAERYVTRLLASGGSQEAWVVADRGALAGLVAVSVDEENRSGWFWYWMTDSVRGRGWTGRAAATVAEWALTVRGLERLELGHRVNNPASGAVARRAGFLRGGTQRGKVLNGGDPGGGRAAATVAEWALTVRGLERLELGHRVNNPASGAVARRAGFIREGTERGKFLIDGNRIDVATYGRLRTDPAPAFDPVPMLDERFLGAGARR